MKSKSETNQLPFFVYGTLLPGQPNYHLWDDSIVTEEPATLANGRLHDLGAYPMLVEGKDDRVRGMLVTMRADLYRQVLARLDELEGYDPARPDQSAYRRARRTVQTASGCAVTAWVYLGHPRFVFDSPAIEEGDWADYAARKPEIAAWWTAVGTIAKE